MKHNFSQTRQGVTPTKYCDFLFRMMSLVNRLFLRNFSSRMTSTF
ncbi:conserved hypothetical protein [delta proteobacterium NaphS2]|nr:conserved hypothetical protein [delta proteobacterium NaphS2]